MKKWLSIFLILITFQIYAQQDNSDNAKIITFSGVVRDQNTGDKLSGVSVTVKKKWTELWQ